MFEAHTYIHTQTHRHTDTQTHIHTHTHKQGEKTVLCCECGRWFRREGDKTRHKCAAERRRPVCEQGGARTVRDGFGAEVAWQCIGA